MTVTFQLNKTDETMRDSAVSSVDLTLQPRDITLSLIRGMRHPRSMLKIFDTCWKFPKPKTSLTGVTGPAYPPPRNPCHNVLKVLSFQDRL